MKKTIIYFIVAFLVGSCSHPTKNSTDISSQSLDPEPEDLSNSQQALVIGNSEYEYSPLSHSINDAKDIADTLRQMGFSVTVKINLNNHSMSEAIKDFGQRLSNSQAQVGLFYFSGHGTRHDGDTFLLPINNEKIQAEVDLKQNAVQAKANLSNMEKSKKSLNIVILDAFYEDPYRGSDKKSSPRDGGAQISLPRGSLIALAAAPDQFALKSGDHSLYTTHLLNVLADAKNKRVEDVFMEAHELVIEASEGKQEPWYQASFREPFCFGGCL